jgi:hypothetical protein
MINLLVAAVVLLGIWWFTRDPQCPQCSAIEFDTTEHLASWSMTCRACGHRWSVWEP